MPLSRLAVLATVFALMVAGCRRSPSVQDDLSGSIYLTTIYPFRSILEPVLGHRGSARNLLPAGSSPHTYDPRPSDARAAAAASTLFYGAPELDGWGARLATGRTVALIDLLPDSMVRRLPNSGSIENGRHGHTAGRDPHFWMDPLAVHALLPPLVDTMCTVEPEFCDDYRENAAVFADRLNVLHDSLTIILEPLAGRAFLLSHPFASYLLGRYGIGVAGIIEEMPGSEPTARDMQRMVNEARQSGADAILVLPQSPDRAARAVSETLNIPLIELDPIGGRVGRSTYEELLLYNARTLMQNVIRAPDAGTGHREESVSP